MYSSVEAFTKEKQLNCSECDSVSNSAILIVKTDSDEFQNSHSVSMELKKMLIFT